MTGQQHVERAGPGGVEVCVVTLSEAWRSLPDAEAVAERAARAAIAHAGCSEPCEVSVALYDDGEVRALNAQYRGQDKPTNVLSFVNGQMLADGQGRVFLGDVIVAYTTMVMEARREDKPALDHLSHLVVHGVMHLLGYDHETDEEAVRMEAKEVEALASLGVPDPYRRQDALEPEAA
ncbi:MAG: rRNA maturation RNase YbeY [Hyphomicrobiales bacterium]|nr:rRNA maturation RNase YbeY [Hyphomicrobiales bacterium]